MWKALWQKWTIDRPAALGDWLWDVFVVQFAAFLDRLTLRKIAVYLPLIILFLAYTHDIPVSPALMFVGDLLAYIDIFAVLVLLGILGRVATIVFFVKQATAQLAQLAGSLMTQMWRLDMRRGRQRKTKSRTQATGGARRDDPEPAVIGSFAWA